MLDFVINRFKIMVWVFITFWSSELYNYKSELLNTAKNKYLHRQVSSAY